MRTSTFTAEDLKEATELIVTTQFPSPSMLERKLRVSMVAACGILDRLSELNILGPSQGTLTRDVLVPIERLDLALQAIETGIPVNLAMNDERKNQAIAAVAGEIPDEVPDRLAQQAATAIVDALIALGWRPTA